VAVPLGKPSLAAFGRFTTVGVCAGIYIYLFIRRTKFDPIPTCFFSVGMGYYSVVVVLRILTRSFRSLISKQYVKSLEVKSHKT